MNNKPYLNILSRETAGAKNRLFGFFRGVVEYNLDPLRVGRCKVRVPAFHSTEESLDVTELPWAWPLHAFGGFHDGGTFIVPPVGSTTFVTFEAGDPEHPIYFGTWYKNPEEEREINYKTSAKTGEVVPTSPIAAGQWLQPIGPEVPREAAASPYHDPTVRIVHKSLKGGTFIIEDRDGFEYTKVIDRAGQELVLSSPVNFQPNSDNSVQRNLKEAQDGTALGYEDLEASTATIGLIGTSGSGLRVVSTPMGESVEILATDPPGEDPPTTVRIRAAGGTGTLEISGSIKGEEKFSLTFDSQTGTVTLNCTNLSINSESIRLAGNVSITGDTRISGDLTVSGDAVVTGGLV